MIHVVTVSLPIVIQRYPAIKNVPFALRLAKFQQLHHAGMSFVGDVSPIGVEPSQNALYAGKQLQQIDSFP
jgi:hypothetical protein